MPRAQSDNRKKAREIFNEHGGNISNREIAGILGCSEKTISAWKCRDNWNRSTTNKRNRSTTKKRGGQPGNRNATGPPKNQHARKHGLFSKWLPQEINEIIGEMPTDPLDILWHNIELQYANIIHSQQILYVKDECDMTQEMNFDGESGTGYLVQMAWDKQAGNMSALSRSMKTLMSMIKEYDELLHKNWDTASDIQKAQLEQMKAQTDKLTLSDGNDDQLTRVDQILEEVKKDAERKAS